MLNFKGVKVSSDFSTTDLDYADDFDLLGESIGEAQNVLLNVSEVAAPVGLKIDIEKNNAMSNARDLNSIPLTLEKRQDEVVNKFKSLGSYIDINSRSHIGLNQLPLCLCTVVEAAMGKEGNPPENKNLCLRYPIPIGLTVRLRELTLKSNRGTQP